MGILEMILYTKTFPLGKDLSFSSYIKALDEQNFSPYTLLIKEIPGTENYKIEIILTDLIGLLGSSNVVINGVLFNECIIKPSKGEREFTLQASIETGNIFLILLSVVPAFILLLFVLSTTFIKGMPLDNILIFLIITIVVLEPLISTYFRERNRLKKIGSLAMELKQEKGI